jgi:protein-S-isoprenylcysteine O-methyltransferase
MLKDPLHWFPGPYFFLILVLLFIVIHLSDYLIPIFLIKQRRGQRKPAESRLSIIIIYLAVVASIALAIGFRYMNWGITAAALQYFGLALFPAAQVLRGWAIVALGRYFSRTVRIEADHRLITEGPYRWFRHPAYTGLVLIYPALALALGTWLGAIVVLGVMSGAIMNRITIEEKLLIATFGNEYREYMKHTWKLFPGW